jgi:PRC-barrel domain
MTVVTGNDRPLGTLEGIIVDPVARHLRYYVVESRDWFTTHRYLVPDTPCRMVPSRGVLQVELDADRLSSLPELRDDEFPPLSTDELGASGRSRF